MLFVIYQPLRTDAPWGLARLSQDVKLANTNTSALFNYIYGSSAGQGVDVYSIGMVMHDFKALAQNLTLTVVFDLQILVSRSTESSWLKQSLSSVTYYSTYQGIYIEHV